MSDTTPDEARGLTTEQVQAMSLELLHIRSLRKAAEWAGAADEGLTELTEQMEKSKDEHAMMAKMGGLLPLINQSVANGLLWAAIAEAARGGGER